MPLVSTELRAELKLFPSNWFAHSIFSILMLGWAKSTRTIDKWNYSNPVDVFFCYFPSKRITIYFQEEFWPTFGTNGISSFFRQEGIGMKTQIIQGKFEGEFLYTKFTMGKNAGAGETFNPGVRFIKW